jgi:hypothetical protein
LDHKYSQANISASALKDDDAHILAFLDPLAQEVGHCLGLGHLKISISGSADDEFGRGGYGRVGFSDWDAKAMIENLFDLEGNNIGQKIVVEMDEEEGETIPSDLEAILLDEKCDDENYEGFSGNVPACTLVSSYCLIHEYDRKQGV